MGSSQSKGHAKDDTRGHNSSPNQEKHNSADSKAPLTKHAANFPRTPSLDRQGSFLGHGASLTQSRSCPDDHEEVQATPRNSTIRVVSQSSSTIRVDELEGHSNISRPPPPLRLRHLSELIDPAELTVDSHIRAPSGNLLAPEQFLTHPNRPRSIRERQEEIKEKVRAASRLGIEAEKVDDQKPPMKDDDSKKKKERRSSFVCGCFGAP